MKSTAPPRLLITGFGPFDATADNPSAHVARLIHPDASVLTVAYDEVDRFLDALKAEDFDAWLMLGFSARAKKVTVEGVARNRIGSHLDVKGFAQPGPIDPDGPEVLRGTLWTQTVLWVPSLVYHRSDDAGTYLCNYLYYRGLQKFPHRRVGFAHVPSAQVSPVERTAQVLVDLTARCVSRSAPPAGSPSSPRDRS